jgi:hypothetical protein
VSEVKWYVATAIVTIAPAIRYRGWTKPLMRPAIAIVTSAAKPPGMSASPASIAV